MNYEIELNKLNEYFFFKEFSFSQNRYKTSSGQEIEIADSIVAIDDIAFIFQVKDRSEPINATETTEEQWFKKKVLGKAITQIKNSIDYIKIFDTILLPNNQNHLINIKNINVETCHKVIIHNSSSLLPNELQHLKFYKSNRAGAVQIVSSDNLKSILLLLITPSEISDYFSFRRQLIQKWNTLINEVNEIAILCQFLQEDLNAKLGNNFVKEIEPETESWDMMFLLQKFKNFTFYENKQNNYYFILKELAKLNRFELREFRIRFYKSFREAGMKDYWGPYRFFISRTGCAFLFLPISKDLEDSEQNLLENLNELSKYDLKASKAVAVSFRDIGNRQRDLKWSFLEYSFKQDDVIDDFLQKNPLFRKMKSQPRGTY